MWIILFLGNPNFGNVGFAIVSLLFENAEHFCYERWALFLNLGGVYFSLSLKNSAYKVFSEKPDFENLSISGTHCLKTGQLALYKLSSIIFYFSIVDSCARVCLGFVWDDSVQKSNDYAHWILARPLRVLVGDCSGSINLQNCSRCSIVDVVRSMKFLPF